MHSPAATSDSTASTIPSVPVGVLSAFPTIVQTGTKPTLTWHILYPSTLSDLVVVNPPGTLIPNQTGYVSVQIQDTLPLGSGDDTVFGKVGGGRA